LLGFPTANVELPESASLPPDGVYGGRFRRADGTTHLAAVSVGTRPTYYAEHGRRLVEAYLLDFEGDLYGEQVSVELVWRLRGQERFASSHDLVDQMGRDVEAVRAAAAPPAGSVRLDS
jgi:riboflavin kinase/FMN adenylyltransferase